MRNFDQMLKQAQQLQAKMQQAQDKIARLEIEGASGGGLVKVVLAGKGEVRSIKIDKSLINPDESEILEDLIVAAINDAKYKLETHTAQEMGKVTEGLPIPPGFGL